MTAIDDDDALFVSETVGRVISAIYGTLQTPNEYDSNGEPANVVDGLFAIAKSIHHLARAYEGCRTTQEHDDYHDGPLTNLPFAEPENRGRTKVRIPDDLVAPRRPVGSRNGHR